MLHIVEQSNFENKCDLKISEYLMSPFMFVKIIESVILMKEMTMFMNKNCYENCFMSITRYVSMDPEISFWEE